jgi:biofilm PGA synthesis N-glycosyltransferase PgaC
MPWLRDLGSVTHPAFAVVALTFIAYVPGFMNTFMLFSLLLDRRPPRLLQRVYPGVTVLIAAYQEEEAIARTLQSIAGEDYPGELEVLVLVDGSTDRTAELAEHAWNTVPFPDNVHGRVIEFPINRGKAAVLNLGLFKAKHDLIVTIDGDSRLREDSLTKIVERLLSDPAGTEAVAGAVLVGNSKSSLIAGMQEWDYFHGIAAVKRMQSLYHGTLVAQGAFSIYTRRALLKVGGWPNCVGEDIVLTWALLKEGYRVGYAEDAVVFTNVPTTFGQFAQQRKRWARGLVEAFHHHERLLVKPRLSTMFIWWNLLFLPMDLVFTFLFVPGLILAAFGLFWLAGPMTLLTLPLAAVWNIVIFRIQRRMLKREGVAINHNWGALPFYVMGYALVMQPVSLWGYASELAGMRKKWGTK